MPNESGQRPFRTSSLLMFELGVIADDRERQAEGDQPGRRRSAERGDELRRGFDGGRELRGLRTRGHFSDLLDFRPA